MTARCCLLSVLCLAGCTVGKYESVLNKGARCSLVERQWDVTAVLKSKSAFSVGLTCNGDNARTYDEIVPPGPAYLYAVGLGDEEPGFTSIVVLYCERRTFQTVRSAIDALNEKAPQTGYKFILRDWAANCEQQLDSLPRRLTDQYTKNITTPVR